MSHKRTPGPWRVDTFSKSFFIIGADSAGEHNVVAIISGETSKTETRQTADGSTEDVTRRAVHPYAQGNTYLMAAAPSMLDALHEAAEVLERYQDADHNGSGFVPNDVMRALQEVRAAIARAEGVAP